MEDHIAVIIIHPPFRYVRRTRRSRIDTLFVYRYRILQCVYMRVEFEYKPQAEGDFCCGFWCSELPPCFIFAKAPIWELDWRSKMLNEAAIWEAMESTLQYSKYSSESALILSMLFVRRCTTESKNPVFLRLMCNWQALNTQNKRHRCGIPSILNILTMQTAILSLPVVPQESHPTSPWEHLCLL